MADAPITVYQPQWAEGFRVTGAALREHLGEAAIRIDHIGNTSIEGLSAKDIIDVQMSVASLDFAADVFRGFEACDLVLGEHAKDDPLPVGLSSGGDWVRKMAIERPGERPVHVHIRQVGSPNERYALVYREYLKDNLAARLNLGKVMDELVRLSSAGIDAYKAIKEPVCDLVMVAAESWASQAKWHMPESDF